MRQLQGEMFLALCYRDLKDEKALQTQIEKVRVLIEQVEAAPRKTARNLLDPWMVPFGVLMVKREMAKLSFPPKAEAK